MISRALTLAYITIGPQMFLPVIVLGLFNARARSPLEHRFTFHFCLVLTLLALAFFPAACAFNFYGFESTLDQTRFTTHFMRLRQAAVFRKSTTTRWGPDLDAVVSRRRGIDGGDVGVRNSIESG